MTSSRSARASRPAADRRRRSAMRGACPARYVRPASAALRLIDAREKRGDDLAQLRQHRVGGMARTSSERMRAHAQQQRFVRLARAVEPDVRLRRRRQQPAQRVERLGANGRRGSTASESPAALRMPRCEPRLHRIESIARRSRTPRPCVATNCCAQRMAVELRRHEIAPARRRGVRCTGCSASIARGTPSGGRARALWSGCSTRPRRPGARRRAAPPNRRRSR